MVHIVFKKINTKANLIWRQSNYLNYLFRSFLCNALMQPCSYNECRWWHTLLNKVLKTKLQIAQNMRIRFCLGLPPPGHISLSHFWKINWLLVERKVELCTSTTVFKYWKGRSLSYLNDMLMPSLINYKTRSQMVLHIPLCRTNKKQKIFSN